MRGRLRQLGWLLLLLMFSGAVACAVEKSASGQKACVPEAQQGKQVVTDCLHGEKSRTPVKGSPDLVKPIFNKEKEQHRLQEAQLIGEIGSQAGDIAETQGKIAGLAAAKAKYGNLSADQLSKTQEYKDAMKPYGKGSALQQGIQAATAAVQGLAGGDIAKAIAGGSSPYLAEVIHKMTTDPTTGKVNTEANLMAHAVLGAVVSQINGNSALAGASGAVAGEIIAQQLYPGVAKKDLTEEQRQTVSALGTLAAGLAGGIVGNSSADAVAGAQAGKNAVENNALSGLDGFGTGFQNNIQAQGSLVNNTNLTDETGKVLNPATPGEIKYASDKLVTGELPDSANITKVIVDGYKDGVLIAGAAYLGPAASVGKVVGGAVIGAIANGSYQWFDISQSGDENKSYDYLGTGAAAITGGLAPGRGIWQNVGIAAGGAAFTDGPNAGAIGGAAAGAWAGGMFGEYAPGIVNSLTGKELPGPVYDFVGGVTSEFVNGFAKDINKPNPVKEEK